jgi:hypothetical protein
MVSARDPEKHVLDLIGDGNRFSDKITRQENDKKKKSGKIQGGSP